MTVEISDEKPINGRSGKGMRFAVTVSLSESLGMTTKGFLAFRGEDGQIEVRPPISYLNLYGKLVRFAGTAVTPELAEVLRAELEKRYGKSITANPDWNARRATRRAEQTKRGWTPDFSDPGVVVPEREVTI